MKKIWIFIGMVTLCYACLQEETRDITLLSYVESFETEAELRGIYVDVSSMDIQIGFSVIDENNIVGQCLHYTDGHKEIWIDENYWTRLTELEKEYLMFHELGHCVLNRGHDNTTNSIGICQSIMQDGTGHCIRRYNTNTRDALIDELFNI